MLENANGACAINFNRMLEIAYGRKGKMKWELLTVRPSLQLQVVTFTLLC